MPRENQVYRDLRATKEILATMVVMETQEDKENLYEFTVFY